jgi:hypothetical protein
MSKKVKKRHKADFLEKNLKILSGSKIRLFRRKSKMEEIQVYTLPSKDFISYKPFKTKKNYWGLSEGCQKDITLPFLCFVGHGSLPVSPTVDRALSRLGNKGGDGLGVA